MNLMIKSRRLMIQPPTEADAERIVALAGDKDVAWMLARVPHPYVLSDAQAWIEKARDDAKAGSEYAFGIYLPGSGMIGSCGLARRGAYWELGYWIGKPYWEQGFATEAGQAVLDWARREIPADAFIAGHIIDNASSGRVLKKLGFEYAGEKRMYVVARDTKVRAMRYALNAPKAAALSPDSH